MLILSQRLWRTVILDELVRSMTPNRGDGFNCLNQGDMWIANILFHYDVNGQPDDCQFVDFQQSVYTSPAIDLLNLIFSSAETETKLHNFEPFVRFYHEQLVEALKLLGYTKRAPTLKELHLDLWDRGFFAVWNGFAVLPACLAENIAESSSDSLLAEDESGKLYKTRLYNNERYKRHMTELLNYFNNRGLVDLALVN